MQETVAGYQEILKLGLNKPFPHLEYCLREDGRQIAPPSVGEVWLVKAIVDGQPVELGVMKYCLDLLPDKPEFAMMVIALNDDAEIPARTLDREEYIKAVVYELALRANNTEEKCRMYIGALRQGAQNLAMMEAVAGRGKRG